MQIRRNGTARGRRIGPAARRLARWGVRHRHIAAGHLLRGVCSGVGTALVGLAVVWFQSRR
ncbi:hypothetical protein CUT44_21370 [Streptomyces carminius]|uniref:Uncharacterized protein n=1 Tax=Streptomyces carminius TaxID=2665496 RepID=A0A2M8LV33_9ACTN|nr:hypothetical protein [Streptomyces carminius]PJE95807.1 hypothetical protein CUT44_21370 [Streptomyces carminius]